MNTPVSYRDLIVWQKGTDLALAVYAVTRTFPEEERFGITNQLRRATVSIPSNIAEGKNRSTRKEYVHFLRIAKGSAAEVETQLYISHKLGYIDAVSYEKVRCSCEEISKILAVLIRKLSP